MTLLIFYLLLAIGVSFFCSIAEAVLLSVRPSYIAVLEHEGKASGKILKNLKDNLDRPLSAILTANTIAHTMGAAGVGAVGARGAGVAVVPVDGSVEQRWWDRPLVSLNAARVTRFWARGDGWRRRQRRNDSD